METVGVSLSVELCGRLADIDGPLIIVAIPEAGCSAGQLRRLIAAQYPALADDVSSPRVRVCVDDLIVDDGAVLAAGQIVALFPPVSGG